MDTNRWRVERGGVVRGTNEEREDFMHTNTQRKEEIKYINVYIYMCVCVCVCVCVDRWIDGWIHSFKEQMEDGDR